MSNPEKQKGKLYQKIKELPREEIRVFEPEHPNSFLNSLYEVQVFEVTNILDEAKAEIPLPKGVPITITNKKEFDKIDLQNLREHAADVYRWRKKWFGDKE
jgi:hypothetical protein